ncbi:MAG: LPS assembly lipoprotein LptE [Victivallaceae bacterium]|nr:LPS assembly lipoprotein LptE [Victivallaceae bacterium]
MMKRAIYALWAVLSMALISGCGYHVGSLAHPQLKTVGVAPVVNNTTAYNVSAQVRGLLCECFMTDGSLKLVDVSKADCIVYTKVTNVTFAQVSWASRKRYSATDEDEYMPDQWRADISIEYSVVMPGRVTPLKSGSVKGSAEFDAGGDLETGRINAIQQAGYEAAKRVVTALTEGW